MVAFTSLGSQPVRLTVLGSSPAWPNAGGACSGYLVEAGEDRVVLDCGPGAFARLRSVSDYLTVSAVLLTHLHADHTLDVVAFASALRYSPRQHPAPVRPALHVPPGGAEVLRGLCAAGLMPADHVERAFALREYEPGEEIAVGALRLRLAPVPHYVPTCAVAVSAAEQRLVYGADHGPSEALVAFARSARLAVLEATLPVPDDPPRGHLTPAEAGEHARAAGVSRLVVTHFTDELDAAWVRAEAERGFGGPVELARPGASYELGSV